jgi:hypothetical protein
MTDLTTVGPLDHSWRLAKCSQEGSAHAFAIANTAVSGHRVDGMSPGFHHQSGRFHTNVRKTNRSMAENPQATNPGHLV